MGSGMFSGINHLHKCGVVHRDMKPANVLLASRLGSKLVSLLERPAVKICDFGRAANLPEHGGLTDICGTIPFRAPEMVQKRQYRSEVDIWSSGIIAHWLFFAELPCGIGAHYSLQPEVLLPTEVIFEGARNHVCPRQPSADAWEFLAQLLNPHPHLRPNATQALRNLDLFLGLHAKGDMSDTDATSLYSTGGTQSLKGFTHADEEHTVVGKADANECVVSDESSTCRHDLEPGTNIASAFFFKLRRNGQQLSHFRGRRSS